MFLPLYKQDKKGGIRVWKIKVTKNIIEVEHGLENGEKIKTIEIIEKGKNIGKKNETTPEAQANLEAQSKWKKKKDTGYDLEISSKEGVVNITPMLAHDYKKFKKDIKFPVYTQQKLDGYRMIYDGKSGTMLSRTGKPYNILEGSLLHEELKKFKDVILDGELYSHDKDFAFEAYGILRKKKLKKDEEKILNRIKFHVYDIISPEKFSKRMEHLKKIIKNTNYIELVNTVLCNDSKCLDKFNEDMVSLGYEGSMIRNPESKYSNFRTKDLLKYKSFDDAEFKVVGFEKETDTKGDGATPVVWVCVNKDGKEFRVPSKGTREERTMLYKNGSKYLGRQLTVQFFGYSKDGIPRFPKTLREGVASFRKD